MCLVGAHIYAKSTCLIFLAVLLVLGTVFVGFFAVHPRAVTLPGPAPPFVNGSGRPTTANFTGFKLDTLLGNLGRKAWGGGGVGGGDMCLRTVMILMTVSVQFLVNLDTGMSNHQCLVRATHNLCLF